MSRARDIASIGSDFGSLATDAELAAATSAIPTGRKNLLYNGAMQVAQRGTSTSSIASDGYYTADRWQTRIVSLGAWTQSVENDAPTGSGFRKSVKMLCTTADAALDASDQLAVRQHLEGQDLQQIAKGTSNAKQLTASFWVKSNVTGTYIVTFFDVNNSREISASYSVSASDTWEQKIITLPVDTTGSFNNDNASSLIAIWWLAAGSEFTSGTLATVWSSATSANRAVGQTNLAAAQDNYWQITGVQLEVGDTATDFEHKPYGVELTECQRYYYRARLNSVDRTFGFAFNRNTTLAQGFIDFNTVMRAAPTALEQSGVATDYEVVYLTTSGTCNAVPVFDGASPFGSDLYFQVASGLTAGQCSKIAAKTTTAYLAWSAEL